MALQPDRQQLRVGAGVGVERGQPIDLGTEHLGLRRRDDFELGSGHRFHSDKGIYQKYFRMSISDRDDRYRRRRFQAGRSVTLRLSPLPLTRRRARGRSDAL